MSDQPTNSQLLIYQTEGGWIKLDVRFECETGAGQISSRKIPGGDGIP
jgi:hypothetical protein